MLILLSLQKSRFHSGFMSFIYGLMWTHRGRVRDPGPNRLVLDHLVLSVRGWVKFIVIGSHIPSDLALVHHAYSHMYVIWSAPSNSLAVCWRYFTSWNANKLMDCMFCPSAWWSIWGLSQNVICPPNGFFIRERLSCVLCTRLAIPSWNLNCLWFPRKLQFQSLRIYNNPYLNKHLALVNHVYSHKSNLWPAPSRLYPFLSDWSPMEIPTSP